MYDEVTIIVFHQAEDDVRVGTSRRPAQTKDGGCSLTIQSWLEEKEVAVAHLLTFKAVGALHHLKVGLYLICGPPLPAIDARPPAVNNLVES